MELLHELMECRALAAGFADGRFAYPGSTPHYAPDRTFDTRHIRLELSLDFARQSLRGRCTTSLEAIQDGVQSMVFDAVDFKGIRVRSAGKPLRHEYNGRKLTLHWPRSFRAGAVVEVTVEYQLIRPKLGLHFVGPDRHYPKKPVQAWTQGEDEYNRYWFPCHDAPQERATTEVLITVPERFTAVSNGALLRTTYHRAKKTRTFHWRQDVPHPPYLVSLVVGEFTRIEDRWKKVPVLYYCPPGREDDARRAFGQTPKMIEFFSRKLGIPYAYAKYAQVAAIDFIYGGMENTSATTQTALTLHDERAHLDFSSDPLVAHELAHQWFGDLVTCKDWSHAWLNESFATYFEALFKEYDKGTDEFMYELRTNARLYFDEDRDRYRRPLVTRLYKNTNDLFDRHLYEKGSLILHSLRVLLGENGWWRSIHLYLKRHRAQGVETVDLLNAIQEATGKNMRPFFDQWIYRAGHPEYKLRSWWDARSRKAFVRVLQTQAVNHETGLFSMPVTFAFYVQGKETRFTETIDKKEHLFSFALPAAPEIVLFDPDHAILKQVEFVKPESMWILQLMRDPHVLGRMDAAQALAGTGSPAAVQALRQALLNDKFWGVQCGIALALGKIGTAGALEVLLAGLKQITHPKTRRAIFEALGQYPSARVLSEVRAVCESEQSYFAQAEAIRTLGKMRDLSLLGLLKDFLKADSWNDMIRSAAIEAIATLQAPESISILKEYSRCGHHPTTRMTAVRRLGALGKGREDIQAHLLELTKDPYFLVQLTVVRALGTFADERATDALFKFTTGDRDGRLKRAAEESIRKIRKGMEKEFPETELKKR
ncbi:MAG: M1 family aminopeptidase [Elusimicrobiota bacterium]